MAIWISVAVSLKKVCKHCVVVDPQKQITVTNLLLSFSVFLPGKALYDLIGFFLSLSKLLMYFKALYDFQQNAFNGKGFFLKNSHRKPSERVKSITLKISPLKTSKKPTPKKHHQTYLHFNKWTCFYNKQSPWKKTIF